MIKCGCILSNTNTMCIWVISACTHLGQMHSHMQNKCRSEMGFYWELNEKYVGTCFLRLLLARDGLELFYDFERNQLVFVVIFRSGLKFSGFEFISNDMWNILLSVIQLVRISSITLYSVRGLERSELGGSHVCPGRLWDRFLWQGVQSIVPSIVLVDLS